MREAPPHILLTNYAMLEYLLLRPADIDLFEGTHGGHWSFIAVDGAHVYDGAKAAELAMLLRRLCDRVAEGRPLRCIATSATVGDKPHSVTEFAQRLFDADFDWVPGEESRQDLMRATRRDMPEGPFWGPLDPADYRSLACSDDPAAERYTQGVQTDTARLKDQGFELDKLKNSWSDEQYKGINSQWSEPDTGQRFEVQFHTRISFEAKQLTHGAYERLRTRQADKFEQMVLEAFQEKVTAEVPVPPGADGVPDYPERGADAR